MFLGYMVTRVIGHDSILVAGCEFAIRCPVKTRQGPSFVMGQGTYALGRIALLPAAGVAIQFVVKSARVVTSMTDARPK